MRSSSRCGLVVWPGMLQHAALGAEQAGHVLHSAHASRPTHVPPPAQAVCEVEALHASAAEQLEGLYEARLALEAARMRQLAAAKDDLELSLRVR